MVRSGPVPHGDTTQSDVAQHVRFDAQSAPVTRPGELARPDVGELLAGSVGVRARLDDACELGDVAGSAGLGASTHGGSLPATERLSTHDGAGDVTVDVGVSDLDGFEPPTDLVVVERVDATGQAEVGGVLQPDRIVEVVGAHDPEHRSEALRSMEPRVGAHVEAYAGGPPPTLPVGVETPRLDEPPFSRLERRERTFECAGRSLDERTHHRRRIVGLADAQADDRIAEPTSETRVVVHVGDDDREARRRALLAGVTERGADEVGDREIEVGGRRDDQGVLAARLAEHAEVRAPVEEPSSRRVRAGEHDGVDVGMADQPGPHLVVVADHDLQHVTGNAGAPELFRDPRSDGDGLRSGLQDDAVAGEQVRRHSTGRDRIREVPRPHHGDDTTTGDGEAGRDRLVERSRSLRRVVPAEVDRLADLGVALVCGLRRVASQQTDRRRPFALHDRCGVEQPTAPGGEVVPTVGERSVGHRDDPVDLVDGIDPPDIGCRR